MSAEPQMLVGYDPGLVCDFFARSRGMTAVPDVSGETQVSADTDSDGMPDFRTDSGGCGHVFGNPSGGFMSLACFKNGSLAREKVRTMVGCDYRFFDETAFELAAGFQGRAFPYFEEEITPKHAATGIEADFDWKAASDAEKVVSIVRGQVLNMYERTRWIGAFDTIRVTVWADHFADGK